MSIDPVTVEVIRSALIYAGEEMGIAVRNSAYSPNIKERLDHSCALFDRRARLIAQAEHIPVHLGSLPWGLKQTLAVIDREHGSVKPDDMWVVNDPYISGTHLNDVTVIRPIFWNGALFGFAANKAHHADVGGMVPGSLSAEAGDLFGEGLIVPPMRLNDAAIALFRANSRTPDARSGDLRAQTAGNYTGERRVLELLDRYGEATLEAAIERILDESEIRMRAALREIPPGDYFYEDVMEDRQGAPSIRIALTMTAANGTVGFDYTGTATQVPYPLNAVYGVTLSGVYYALRAVTDPTIPMNEGCFRPVSVNVPQGTLLNPVRPAAVGGGNVETSTRNADVVLGVLAAALPDRVPAQSGGTMSNVMIGGIDERGAPWAFYETNGCGMGARPDMDGLSGIQCHMTNTLNTPVEAIEREYPLRVMRYEFADGTGGPGKFRGGDGLVRELQLTGGTARASLLADRHTVQPHGARGGGNGATGAHDLQKHDGSREGLRAKTTFALEPGDAVSIRTPGGGGYGVGDGAGRGDGDATGAVDPGT